MNIPTSIASVVAARNAVSPRPTNTKRHAALVTMEMVNAVAHDDSSTDCWVPRLGELGLIDLFGGFSRARASSNAFCWRLSFSACFFACSAARLAASSLLGGVDQRLFLERASPASAVPGGFFVALRLFLRGLLVALGLLARAASSVALLLGGGQLSAASLHVRSALRRSSSDTFTCALHLLARLDCRRGGAWPGSEPALRSASWAWGAVGV